MLVRIDDVRVAGQGATPEGVELVAQRGDGGGVEAVDPAGAGRSFADEAGLFQHLEVLGDGRAADRQLGGEFPDRLGTVGKLLDDGQPGGVAKGGPCPNAS